MKTKNNKLTLVLLLFAMLVLTASAQQSHAQPQIWTDKPDYAPWETVTLYGSGFSTDSVIIIRIEAPPDCEWPVDQFGSDNWQDNPYVINWQFDGLGGFTLQYDQGLCEGTFYVTALDEEGNVLAETTFTDTTNIQTVNSSDSSGMTKTSFLASEDVYAHYTINGSGETTYRVYLISSPLPSNGGSLVDVSGGYETVTPSTDGTIEVWAHPTSAGTYYIVFDTDGTYNTTGSAIHSTVSASFTISALATHNVSVTFAGTGSGTVALADTTDSGYNDSLTNTGNIAVGINDAGTLTATADPGSYFDGWSSESTGFTNTGSNPCDFSMNNADQSITATFNIAPTTYTVSFTQSGSGIAPTVTYQINSGSVTTDTVPFDVTVNADDVISYSYESTITGGDTRYVLTNTNPTSPQTVNSPLTITGTYQTQYLVHYEVTGNDIPVTPPTDEWVISGNPATGVFPSSVTNVAGDTRSIYDSDDRPSTITGPTIITATYINQYKITFAQTGLDSSASGTVVSGSVISPSQSISLSGDFSNTGYWADEGTAVDYEYANIVASSVPGYQFWLYDVTGPISPFDADGPYTITGNYRLLPKSAVTAGGCLFDVDKNPSNGQQFRLIFTPDLAGTNSYKLNASNPGQFFYNVFYLGDPEDEIELKIEIPYPFVTQGATPVHIYSGVEVYGDCYMPLDEIGGFTITGTDTVTPNGSLGIALDDFTDGFVELTVSVDVPASGLAYVRIHLDYGLKKTYGYSQRSNSSVGGYDAVDDVTIFNLTEYSFSYTDDTVPIDIRTIQNINVFKHDPGFAGIVIDSSDTPVEDVRVQIYNSSGSLLATVYTDEDGFYFYSYKHKGKAATYTIVLPDYGISKSVMVKANGLVVEEFQVD